MPKLPESFSQDESQEEEPKEIKDAESLDELFKILDRKGKITGSSGKEYSSEELKKKIKNVNNKLMSYTFTSEDDPLDSMALIKNDLTQITGGEGLRDKVSEIIYKDVQKMLEDINANIRERWKRTREKEQEDE